ncbi:GlsB/YeaQ/YmgE family stress response membrane protein [Altererythrobacter sp. KTW20L]|uniref:GlsB/YeaQ/YmgE family stress response membrane protein n=1 Tax=Altererythrobacter sp. KTW20L TaxID=2942210 RepID=UPI0020BDA5CF|nr:GlsB/YeaQ/YmgE family stress response membrane protein [Altererythrobacter sp. KTW20L]MCL6249892.1 GlsB/YeaQ/YmgE family stress response membrane protein [Altererythrobacter sp. KTW20L]
MDLFVEYGWLGWIIVGGLAGALAKLLMPGKDGGNIFVTILLGIAGAAVAGFVGSMIGWYEPGEGPGFIAAVIGALVLLAIYRQVKKGKAAG